MSSHIRSIVRENPSAYSFVYAPDGNEEGLQYAVLRRKSEHEELEWDDVLYLWHDGILYDKICGDSLKFRARHWRRKIVQLSRQTLKEHLGECAVDYASFQRISNSVEADIFSELFGMRLYLNLIIFGSGFYLVCNMDRASALASVVLVAAFLLGKESQKNELSKQTEIKKCCVCWVNGVNRYHSPCGHSHLCHECCSKVNDTCPICRAPVRAFLPLYL